MTGKQIKRIKSMKWDDEMFKFKSRLQRAGAAADSLVPSPELAWAGENGWNGVRCDRAGTCLPAQCVVVVTPGPSNPRPSLRYRTIWSCGGFLAWGLMTSPETVETGGKTLSSDFRQQRDLGMSPQKLRDYQSFLENRCVCDDTILPLTEEFLLLKY